ncbi:MAG: glycosyltransferase [Anoxybacillus sp.]|nr:glycosyltransferase [Anoxybacillus sp.]
MRLANAPLVSLIIPVKNEGEHIKNTIESAVSVKTDCDFEIIVVDDASEDGCCDFLDDVCDGRMTKIKTEGLGAANARNAGAKQAKGDLFIFCDAHLFFEDYWMERLIEPIQNGTAAATNPGIGDVQHPQNIGYGYTWNEKLEPKWNRAHSQEPHPSPLLAGGCLAISRKAFEHIGGFEKGFKVWGREDEEISLKLWLFGYECYIVPSVTILHVFRPTAPPFELTWGHVDYNLLRMTLLHFSYERFYRSTKLIQHSLKTPLLANLLQTDVIEKRRLYEQKRVYDDEWFMKKFHIPF